MAQTCAIPDFASYGEPTVSEFKDKVM